MFDSRNGNRKSYSKIHEALALPPLIEVQRESFDWLAREGLRDLFDEVSPIVSFNKQLELHFGDYRFGEPTYDEAQCRERDMTYAAPLWVRTRLVNRETGEISEQEVFMGDFPLMTENGTFIVNGAERVVVSQLIRSPGCYFTIEEDRTTGRNLCMAKLIPDRGAWLEFETSRRDILSVKVDRKRKLPVTLLLRALGVVEDGLLDSPIKEGTDEELLALFEDANVSEEHDYVVATIERDPTKSASEAVMEFYRRLRPGDPVTADNARSFLQGLLFDPRRYDLSRVGRYMLNRRLRPSSSEARRTLIKDDLVAIVRRMIQLNNGDGQADDIDHLGNRRVKTVGELIQNHLRIGLLRMERVVRERMSIRDPERLTPVSLVNIRPVVAAMREFFGGSQLSQFMDQTNPLAELNNKRRLSALGPGGLHRDRAGFDVRDVHHSHYGRICPIETPEGPNIGLIGSLATFGRVNEYGFVETPYRKVVNRVANSLDLMVGEILREDVVHEGETIARAGQEIDEDLALRLAQLPREEFLIRPRVTDQIEYLSADDEEKYVIAQANAPLDEHGRFVEDRVDTRQGANYAMQPIERVAYMDVSPKQVVGVSAALIPFLEHDDANRALMGSNMQRQAVPLLQPDAPLVGTGVETRAAQDSGQVLLAQEDGEVISVTGERIVVLSGSGQEIEYPLRRFRRSNQSTCIDQRPIVEKGQRVSRGQPLADSSSTCRGELALGQNVLVAFISWEGGNYEDAILISEELVRQDKYTSIHIEKHEIEARDTKLGPEEITRDIPNVGEEALKDLDEEGIVRIGAEVGPGDILVGKITPKGETELTPEEKLLRAIFGEKAREVKDSSLRLPHGEKGKVVDVKVFTREEHRDLPAGVDKMVRVSVAQRRKLTEGDKMSGRHGNKGVVSRIVPIADMPFLEDGTAVQIILNPLGVPGRMNIGQIMETHLGWAANRLGFQAITPVFDGASEREIAAELARAYLVDRAWRDVGEPAWEWARAQGYAESDFEDDSEVRQVYAAANYHGYDWERILRDPAYSRDAILREWLRARGYEPDSVLISSEETDQARRAAADELARTICWRTWIEERGYDAADIPDDQLEERAREVQAETGWPVPTTGKMRLYDGKTGEPFDQPVTVGYINMMKLVHLVEDKVHARSTGPYSLVTQQPLGGKAQFGGQRFGEMEVWALEAYGAAYTLQEMLTIKSDDVTGRVKTYEAIVKGEPIEPPGVPESFRVLVKEMQSLGLSIQVFDEKGQTIEFGKEQPEERVPRLPGGLTGLPGLMRGG
ncbi:MAG: DNA-directed RNA polymerase subunit beta [Anaerolineae bacterium]|nr:DNA-directed RNA polymerase subunit beta [Anaerolineae bacterium]